LAKVKKMNEISEIMNSFHIWLERARRQDDGLVAKGTLSGALVIFDKLKQECKLDIDYHTAKGKSQLAGVTGSAVRRILLEFGETRRFTSEGGRTNRGLRGAIAGLLVALKQSGLDKCAKVNRITILTEFQKSLVEEVRKHHNLERLKISYSPLKTAFQMIYELLESARKTNKGAQLAQHIIGAKLAIRFPDVDIKNESYSTSDSSTGRHGDFEVGNTVFHVTLAPSMLLYEKCRANLENGYRVYILVPNVIVVGTQQTADQEFKGTISVQSIEHFVSQNIDELSQFSSERMAYEFRKLLDEYNERVDSIEPDKSLLIYIPDNLRDLR